MTQLATSRLLLALSAVLAACTTTPSDRSDSPAAQTSSAEAVAQAALVATTHCMLEYIDDRCPGGTCPSVIVGRLDLSDGGDYPAFIEDLGTPDLPYAGFAAATAKWVGTGPLHDDGYFDLGIHDRDSSGLAISSEAEVSLGRLATDPDVEAGDLRAKVAPFAYHGQTYDSLEMLCYLTPN